MKNEINSELLTTLIEDFIIKNKRIFDNEPNVKKLMSKDTETNDGLLMEIPHKVEIITTDELIEEFYDEIRYDHNMPELNFDDFLEKINEVYSDMEKRKDDTFQRLKNTEYIHKFVLKNHDNISEDSIDELIDQLKEKGFYPIDKNELLNYIKSIELIEEEIPYKPSELKTKLDEEFREYVIKFISLIDKQRIKFGISEEKFKSIVVKILKIDKNNLHDPRYDYKTKKYVFLKEIAEHSKEISPYYIVKYFNVETGKLYYSVYSENGVLMYNMLDSKQKAFDIAKNLKIKNQEIGTDSKAVSEKKEQKLIDNKTDITTGSNNIYTSKEIQDMNLSYHDEEISKDLEFIQNRIQKIHGAKDKELSQKGGISFTIFRVIAWIMAFTVILSPFAFLIILGLRTYSALTGRSFVKVRTKTFLKITKIMGWIFTFTIVLSPIGIPMLLLTYITENAEHKYKIELTKNE